MANKKMHDGLLDGELLKTEQAAQILQMEPQALCNWRLEHRGPPYLKLGGKVRYPKHLLIEWAMKSLVVPNHERVA